MLEFFARGTAALVLVCWSAVAFAQEPTYPATLRVGIVPPPNFVASPTFPGFEHNDRAIRMLLSELPGYVFEGLQKEVDEDLKKAPGLITREDVELKSGAKGFILKGTLNSPQGPVFKWTMAVRSGDITGIVVVEVPDAVKEFAPYDAVRASLDTVTIRQTVPNEEYLAALPFAINDLAGYRFVRVQPGNAAMLTEGPKDAVEIIEQPLIMITIAPMPQQPKPEERDGIARRLLGETGALKDVRVTQASPLRIANQQAYELQIDAKDAKSNNDLKAIQWIRFGQGTIMKIFAVTNKDAWETHYPRLRQLRDGIGPK
ncbi:hypothetical protein GJW-30_1_04326 [Variibacter gotjawalensis]|uniref:Uncharacterized protein n=1 Tax=Variibacter gotjawalensis TaxID=1333996 RepID=A0A0S3Q0Q8_9BRAD|nr:hypothetical protein [Variibacter gotjawalensis]NIK47605.1 hypothetical protein [Variibacter gotjawalensis]RZS49502.1 hypothetical protein EV661_1936 [Variibacter gotjawalensis]BAT61765.1 hypothetical protein GJW-30_1_04326 [Variibacter gotjawalensis]